MVQIKDIIFKIFSELKVGLSRGSTFSSCVPRYINLSCLQDFNGEKIIFRQEPKLFQATLESIIFPESQNRILKEQFHLL